MTEQYQRRLTLEIGKVKIEAAGGSESLRVVFAIERDTEPYPNSAEIAIYNLSPKTRGKIAGSEIVCRLSAGYGDDEKQIFYGILRKIAHTRTGTDIVTSVSMGDGEEGPKVATINRCFAVGTPVANVLDTIISATRFGKGNIGEIAGQKLPFGQTLIQPWTFAGPATEALTVFCRSIGVEWSVQAGDLQFLRAATPFTATQGPLVSPQTGLIGSPRQELDREGGLLTLGTVLLAPDLIPGVRFQIMSADVSGVFAARKVRHYGDTHGPQWYSDFEAVS